MSGEPSIDEISSDQELVGRRLFLRGIGKWSGAAIAAVIFGSAWVASPPKAEAGVWVNRRGGYGGGWINGRGGYGGGWINGRGGYGGGWINGGGGGAWVNRRYYGGGGAWVNRW
jgi:hypothetical protein